MRITAITLLFIALFIEGVQNLVAVHQKIADYFVSGQIINLIYGILFALAFLFLMILPITSYFLASKLIERSLNKFERIRDKRIVELVEQFSKEMKVRAPEVGIIETEVPNCFVYGGSLRRTRIILTSGLLKCLSEEELRSVITHELSHVLNRDVGFMTWGTVVVQALKWWSLAFLCISLIFGVSATNPFNFLRGTFSIQFIMLILWTLLFPLLTIYSVSRIREYLADARASLFTSADTLLTALSKINLRLASSKAKFSTLVKPLMICPLGLPGKYFKRLFSTHPTLKERLQALNEKRFIQNYQVSKTMALYSGLSAGFIYYSFILFFGNMNLPTFLNYLPIILTGIFLGSLNCVMIRKEFSLKKAFVLNMIGSFVSCFLFFGPISLTATTFYYINNFAVLVTELLWQLLLLVFLFLILLASSSFVSLLVDDLLKPGSLNDLRRFYQWIKGKARQKRKTITSFLFDKK